MEEAGTEILQFKHVSFSYPDDEVQALQNVSFGVKKGEFSILAGVSGSGKSTLLRHCKPVIAPNGTLYGEVQFQGKNVKELETMEQVSKIGFVFQKPENQLVCNRVDEELAFGLENLGVEPGQIRRRIAELVTYFGMNQWYEKEVHELSGGQKQILNLASVMAMNPELLILDEPTAWLDPVSAEHLIDMICRINRDMGTTILLSEQRLESVLPAADQLVILEKGKVICNDIPERAVLQIIRKKHLLLSSMPATVQFFAGMGGEGECPLRISDGRKWLEKLKKKGKVGQEISETEGKKELTVVKGSHLYFRYERKGQEVLQDVSMSLKQGKVFALTGGNGSGKTTLLNILTGNLKPHYGTVKVHGKVGILPQDVRFLFTENCVEEELMEIPEEMERVVFTYHLKQLLKRHPYDLSGGEAARLALAKLDQRQPDIYFLDEPTKGLDCIFKKELLKIIKQWAENKKTVLIVSHDIEFLAEVADYFYFLFHGEIAFHGTKREFASENLFYTTDAAKMARGVCDGVVTVEDLVRLCKAD